MVGWKIQFLSTHSLSPCSQLVLEVWNGALRTQGVGGLNPARGTQNCILKINLLLNTLVQKTPAILITHTRIQNTRLVLQRNQFIRKITLDDDCILKRIYSIITKNERVYYELSSFQYFMYINF